MRIIFAGTPEFAAGNLQALIEAGIIPVAVYSQPDRPKGRGKKLVATPVKAIALEYDIPVFQPLNFKEQDELDVLNSHNADLMIVVAYGLLLPKAVLSTPRLGCINVHASLLPRWRGAAPIERAIEYGDNETGVTIMQMDEGLDTGDMLSISRCDITHNTTGDSLRAEIQTIGASTLIETVTELSAGVLTGEKQDDALANYAKKLTKQEAELDWSCDAQTLLRKIHAFNSANACYSLWHEERVKFFHVALSQTDKTHASQAPGSITAITKKIIEVACGKDGSERLQLKEIQLPNAKRMPVAAVLNGKKDFFQVGQAFSAQN